MCKCENMEIIKIILFLFIKASYLKTDFVNVAVGKKTNQTGEKWPSKNAVDGIKHCPINVNGTYYTLTDNSHSPSWQVDLGDLFKIERINVYGRYDSIISQLQGFRLFLSPKVFNKQSEPVYTNTAGDYNNGYINVTSIPPGHYRYVKLEVPDKYRKYLTNAKKKKQEGPIVLCEVEVLVNAKNVALRKSVTMSQYISGWDPYKAADNSTSQNANDCKCCSHSSNSQQPWLTVNLGKQYNIIQIKAIGRTDDLRENRRLNGLQIFTNSSQNLLNNYAFNTSQDRDIIIFNPVNLSSQYVTLRRPGQGTEWYLVVCELQVFVRECDNGTYGTRCDQKCGHCRKSPCNVDTGFCSNGECLAGWNGNVCKTACTAGKFGPNCLFNCSVHCLSGVSQCDKATGKCNQGCEAGFMRDNCSEECNPGNFGPNCNSTCSDNCFQGVTQCRKTTGECIQGCDAGYTGRNCSASCRSGRFGKNCSSYCSVHCLNGKSQCDKATGECIQGCDAGFMGTNCSKVCPNGNYGPDCKAICSNHCFNGNVQCNKTTGDCVQGCIAGYFGRNCSTECLNGTFGVNCKRLCHCMDGVACSKTDGVCRNGCAFGWTGDDCSKDLNLISRIREKITTKQSSTYENKAGYNSSKAIDGVQNYAVYTCGCCSVTDWNSPAWWQINLKQKFLIGSLKIFGRQSGANEQLENATIHAGNITMEGNISAGTFVYKVPSMDHNRKFTFNLSKPIIAQYFKVQLLIGTLTLCEFSLFEKECEVGSFGSGCSHHCHCSNKTKCNPVTGNCRTPSCLPGWKGEACDKDRNILRTMTELANTSMSSTVHNWTSGLAIDGNVGPDPDACHCCSGTQNSQTSWWMVDMSKRFPVNRITVYSRRNEQTFQQLTDFQLYFANGTMAHSYVLIGNNTRKVLGTKHELTFPSVVTRYIKIQRPGILTLCEVRVYKGECPVGTFGDECLQRCHCADERACDAITGHCQSPACKTGWIGLACNKQCPQDTFGDKCTETCFCAEGTCTNNYGICHGKCRSGYTGSHCNEVEVIKTENKTDVRSSSEYRSAQIIGVAVGGSIAVLFAIVAISVIIYKYRKRNSTSDSKHDYATPDITHAQVETEYDTLDNLNDNQDQGNNSYENERVSAF